MWSMTLADASCMVAIYWLLTPSTAPQFHGSSHQAAMVFQAVVPKQLRAFDTGRHRLRFIYQAPAAFAKTNLPDWLGQMKSDAGFAKVAGVELTLLDCARYFHKAGGISGVAQIAQDLGAHVAPRKLAKAAAAYENSAVRRLGYLLNRSSSLRPIGTRKISSGCS